MSTSTRTKREHMNDDRVALLPHRLLMPARRAFLYPTSANSSPSRPALERYKTNSLPNRISQVTTSSFFALSRHRHDLLTVERCRHPRPRPWSVFPDRLCCLCREARDFRASGLDPERGHVLVGQQVVQCHLVRVRYE